MSRTVERDLEIIASELDGGAQAICYDIPGLHVSAKRDVCCG